MAGAARGLMAAGIVLTGIALAVAPSVRAQSNAAHDLAQRFAVDAEKSERHEQTREKARIEALRKQEENDMLARAHAEAQARRAAMEEARRAQEAAEATRIAGEARQKAEEARRIAAEKAAAEAERVALEKRRQEEAARLAEAARHAEAEKRRTAVIAAEKAMADAEHKRMADEAAARERRRAELVAQRDAETRRLTETLRAARERRVRHETTATMPPVAPAPSVDRAPAGETLPVLASGDKPFGERAALGGPAVPAEAISPDAVTVLIMMQPGHRGIRRHSKTADPVLCGAGGCYVSNGADAEAMFYPGHRALGLRRTLSGRAGACKNTLGCVFRGVDLAVLHHFLQPVDMRLVRHDRREGHFIERDSRCRMDGPRLTCAEPVMSSDYVMWLVPEALAARVGPGVLEQALWDGLGDGATTGPVSFRN